MNHGWINEDDVSQGGLSSSHTIIASALRPPPLVSGDGTKCEDSNSHQVENVHETYILGSLQVDLVQVWRCVDDMKVLPEVPTDASEVWIFSPV